MTDQLLLKWISLPRPLKDQNNVLSLSVFLSPEVTAEPNALLKRFPLLAKWMAREHAVERHVTFNVVFAPALKIPDKNAAPAHDGVKVDPDLWKALFPGSLPVRQPNAPPLKVASAYSVKEFHQEVQGVYQDHAKGSALPKANDLAPSLDRLRANTARFGDVYALPASAPRPKDFDFHQTLSAVGHYPRLMRRIGLVFDIQVALTSAEVKAITDAQSAHPELLLLRVIPKVDVSVELMKNAIHVEPWTAFAWRSFGANEHICWAAPRPRVAADGPAQHEGGLLLLKREQHFHAHSVDVDAGVGQLRGLGEKITGTTGTNDVPLPARQSAGINVVIKDRGVGIATQVSRTTQLSDAVKAFFVAHPAEKHCPLDGLPLYVEDVVRGHRIDVTCIDGHGPDRDRFVNGRWYSLCERQGSYKAANGVGPSYDDIDEGFVSTGGVGNADLAVHESLFRWTGAPLCVPIATTGQKKGSLVSLATSFAIARGEWAAPPLRFGWSYQVRARQVDLAGNSLDPVTVDWLFEKRLASGDSVLGVTHHRYEAIKPPVVFPRDEHAPVVELSIVQTSARPGDAKNAEYLLLPPPVTTVMAGWSGLISGKQADRLARISEVERLGRDPDAFAEALGIGRELPYFHDVTVRRARLTVGKQQALVDFAIDQRNGAPRPIRLIVEPHTDGDGEVVKLMAPPTTPKGVVRVQVAAGRQIDMAVSSGINDESLAYLGHVGSLFKDHVVPESVKVQLRQGTHANLTPGATVRLTHATPTPKQAPMLISKPQRAEQKMNAPGIRILNTCKIDVASTGAIDCYAWWKDVEDRLHDKGDKIATERSTQVLHRDIDGSSGSSIDNDFNHQFSDTRYRTVYYTPFATTRFTQYYPEGKMPAIAGPKLTIDVLSTERPRPAEILYVLPAFRWEGPNEPDGATTRRGGSLRIYLARPWYTTGDGEELAVLLLSDDEFGRVHDPWTLPFVTQWGGDPVWGSPSGQAKVRPGTKGFKNQFSGGRVVAPITLRHQGSDYKVDLVTYPVLPDSERKLWYCDINIDLSEWYWPFVRLVVARYQEHSFRDPRSQSFTSDLRVSEWSRADFVQLAPNRTATCRREKNSITVEITDGARPPLNESLQLKLRIEKIVPGSMPQFLYEQCATLANNRIIHYTLPDDAARSKVRLVLCEYERFDSNDPGRIIYAQEWER